ncbi:MAG: NAD-dependent malic enzyme [Microbacteriaceae bacterium]|jgi:malate dehydrogenase (oxaloacetate-decarboxylating)|nr:NAD-dependent malic enzyme [Microbacteriaceae bacterium]MCI1207091.1 NAD-dependent malic enzyme [Microbacteriaceae bacterium]
MDSRKTQKILAEHEAHTGVLSIAAGLPVHTSEELGEAYTPGVAELSLRIAKKPSLARRYTVSGKLVAVITDGSAVLGLGNVGAPAGLPIVEGKALLYRQLAGVDAVPLAVDQVSADEMVTILAGISSSFAGIHLEDIAAPKCFEVEDKLRQRVDIPVYHDDQEGTAIVVLAALRNAAQVVGKALQELTVVVNGVGASGYATARLLHAAGIRRIIPVDVAGIVTPESTEANRYQRSLAQDLGSHTPGRLADAVRGADAFVGLSVGGVLTGDMVRSMAPQPIIFALANPVQEIAPAEALEAGAAVVATGASSFPNQVNNILAFPGLFKALLSTGIRQVDTTLQLAVADGLASLVASPSPERIIPGVFEPGVVDAVVRSVEDYDRRREAA